VIVGTLYALVDGCIGGAVFGWHYSLVAGDQQNACFSGERGPTFRNESSDSAFHANRMIFTIGTTANTGRQNATILPCYANPTPDGVFGKETLRKP